MNQKIKQIILEITAILENEAVMQAEQHSTTEASVLRKCISYIYNKYKIQVDKD